MGAAGNFAVELTEDPGLFTDAGLRDFEVVVFLNTDGEGILNAAQRTAVRALDVARRRHRRHPRRRERRPQLGLEGRHDGRRAGSSTTRPAPSSSRAPRSASRTRRTPPRGDLPPNWARDDEWYNFTAEPRGKVHVLATLDESTYEEQDGSAAADDHPIAWCSNYDGGRHFYTALGHHGAAWQEPLYL